MMSLESFYRFLLAVFFLSRMSIFSRNLNHHWRCREQKINHQKILLIIFWKFTMIQYRLDSLLVRRNVISGIANLVYDIIQKLPNDLKLRFLSNKEILGKSQNWMETQPSANHPFQNLQSKYAQNQISNFSCPVQFYWISLFCSKYFIRDCGSLSEDLSEPKLSQFVSSNGPLRQVND